MSVNDFSPSCLRQQWRACRRLLPEAAPRIPGRGRSVKRFLVFSGILAAVGLLGMVSYRVRELIAALALFSILFGVLFLIALTGVLVQESAMWLRIQAPQWNRAGRDWALEFAHSLRGRYLWPRWTRRISTPAVPFADSD